MSWQKHGLLVEPLGHGWSTSHAALPAPLLNPDGSLRVYLSTRDARGRSHIGRAHVQFDRGRATLDTEPVLAPGRLGAFDDSGVTSSCAVEHGERTYLYFSGWSLGKTVPFYLFVGCAVSDDGDRFERASTAPILERSSVDPYLTASPWVLVENDVWRMWYVSATGWEETAEGPRHRYHIRYAESADGLVWRREGRVCIDFADDSEYAISRPCVVRDGNLYRMWYASRGSAYRIGYAESDDGLVWRRLDRLAGIEPAAEGWDSEMQAYPAVTEVGGRNVMLYNGNDYGRDGVGWAILEG